MLYKQDIVCFTKKFRTLDPHPPTVKEKVLNKTVFFILGAFPNVKSRIYAKPMLLLGRRPLSGQIFVWRDPPPHESSTKPFYMDVEMIGPVMKQNQPCDLEAGQITSTKIPKFELLKF